MEKCAKGSTTRLWHPNLIMEMAKGVKVDKLKGIREYKGPISDMVCQRNHQDWNALEGGSLEEDNVEASPPQRRKARASKCKTPPPSDVPSTSSNPPQG